VAQYALGTLLGMLPGVLATSVFAYQIAAALRDLSRLNYWILGAVIVVFIAVTWIASRWVTRESVAQG